LLDTNVKKAIASWCSQDITWNTATGEPNGGDFGNPMLMVEYPNGPLKYVMYVIPEPASNGDSGVTLYPACNPGSYPRTLSKEICSTALSGLADKCDLGGNIIYEAADNCYTMNLIQMHV
jgi:hypothetical protein